MITETNVSDIELVHGLIRLSDTRSRNAPTGRQLAADLGIAVTAREPGLLSLRTRGHIEIPMDRPRRLADCATAGVLVVTPQGYDQAGITS